MTDTMQGVVFLLPINDSSKEDLLRQIEKKLTIYPKNYTPELGRKWFHSDAIKICISSTIKEKITDLEKFIITFLEHVHTWDYGNAYGDWVYLDSFKKVLRNLLTIGKMEEKKTDVKPGTVYILPIKPYNIEDFLKEIKKRIRIYSPKDIATGLGTWCHLSSSFETIKNIVKKDFIEIKETIKRIDLNLTTWKNDSPPYGDWIYTENLLEVIRELLTGLPTSTKEPTPTHDIPNVAKAVIRLTNEYKSISNNNAGYIKHDSTIGELVKILVKKYKSFLEKTQKGSTEYKINNAVDWVEQRWLSTKVDDIAQNQYHVLSEIGTGIIRLCDFFIHNWIHEGVPKVEKESIYIDQRVLELEKKVSKQEEENTELRRLIACLTETNNNIKKHLSTIDTKEIVSIKNTITNIVERQDNQGKIVLDNQDRITKALARLDIIENKALQFNERGQVYTEEGRTKSKYKPCIPAEDTKFPKIQPRESD